MRTLRNVIATDIPEPQAPETEPLAVDDDITRRDAWMFVPLIATVVALPLVMTTLLAFSTWHLANRTEASLFSKMPTTFAARWPEKSMPMIRLGG